MMWRRGVAAFLLAAAGCVGGQRKPDPGAVHRVAETLAYQQQVVEAIRRGWERPIGPPGRIAVVMFGVAPDGRIGNIQLMQSSGDDAFDTSALRAVERQQRVPPPPAHAAVELNRFEMYFGSD